VKNRFHLITAFILALTLSGGVHAYTFTTAGATINITEPIGDIATTNATETQPDWVSILEPVEDTYIFRPNASGNETLLEEQYPAEGEHWDKVSENTSDGDSTYVATNNATWREDLYNITHRPLYSDCGGRHNRCWGIYGMQGNG